MADITSVPTAAGFLFLAVVLDAWSRRIVGWAMATELCTRLVLDALDMAMTTRKPADVVHHSDQGSQYTSVAFGSRCKEAGLRASTGSVGDAYGTAMAAAFSATLGRELPAGPRDRHSLAEARVLIERWRWHYNTEHLHGSLGYQPTAPETIGQDGGGGAGAPTLSPDHRGGAGQVSVFLHAARRRPTRTNSSSAAR